MKTRTMKDDIESKQIKSDLLGIKEQLERKNIVYEGGVLLRIEEKHHNENHKKGWI